jgi:hypothetical protein
MGITNILNTREMSIAFWLLIVIGIFLSNAKFRTSIPGLLKAFFTKKLFLPFLLMLFYIFVMIVVFERIRFWDTTALKDTFLWFFGVAFVLFVNLNNAATDEKFFSKIIIGFISVIVIFEFIVNLYTFHIFIELVLVPFTTILVLMSKVAELKPEHKQVKKVFDFILAIIGIVVIIFTIRAFWVIFKILFHLRICVIFYCRLFLL